MFEYLMMAGTYDSRKVDRSEFDWGFISTASVNDGEHPYETAVKHKDYGDGKIIIVEAYECIVQAQAGHKKWVKTMTAKRPPAKLTDCVNAGVAQFAKAFGCNLDKSRTDL